MSRSACIVPEQLEWLLNGQLVGPELEGITAHVQNCEACQQVLERLTRVPVPEGVGGPDRDGPTGDASFFERPQAQVPVPSDKARPESDNPTLEVPFPPADGQGPLSPPEHVDPSVEPGTIGRYRVIRRLRPGGFGRVYLAQDEDLDRPVAVKVPNPERICRPEDIEAYLTEARILARLDHPISSRSTTGADRTTASAYVVSKYVEGSRPGGADQAGPAHFQRFGGAGGGGRRGPAPRPYPGTGPPGRQARQHPDRRPGQASRRRLRAGAQGRGLRQGGAGSSARPPI